MDRASFIFTTCQVGAEAALKAELAQRGAIFRFAYSRPGFLTFKLPTAHSLADNFELNTVFARTHGFSLGKARGESLADCAAQAWQIAGDGPYDRLHVWRRDLAPPGYRGFEPGTAESTEAEQLALVNACPLPTRDALLQETSVGQLVLDCVLVEPHEWWIGYHQASSPRSRWPGGIPKIDPPADMVSRAYLKMEEAIEWSRLPMQAGHACAEIGSAPGGASQSLLNRGMIVLGIDPAEMDPYVLAHPNFRHLKMRGADVRKREFRDTRWLTADVNVAPNYTLDTVESIVTHNDVRIEGMLLTLKLLDWKLAAEIPHYLDRIRSWGYGDVRARQLGHNKQEICVAALRQRSLRRRSRGPAKTSLPRPQ